MNLRPMRLSSLGSRRAIALATFVSAVTVGASAGQRPSTPGQDMTSAEECGRCHQDIHRNWKESLHARAADNPRFQDAFGRARAASAADPGCLRCHAPALVYMRDVKWEKKTSWEGVTCDFCHSVRSLRADPDRPFVLEVGRVKTGPLKGAQPTTHDAAYSEVYTSSTLCAPCHQFTNERKFDVLTTYSEWQAGSFASRNMTCQTCHMRATAGNVVDPKIARSAELTVNVHEMPGGHSVNELNRALLAQIAAERKGGTIEVTVQLTNRGAGHKLPTGSPLRALVMVVGVDNGVGSRHTATRTYSRVVVDEAGRELQDEAGVFQRAARETSDSRLAPGERRVERFSFAMPAASPVRAVARFFYRYAPDAGRGPEPGMLFQTVTAWVDAARK